jgi:hypothetical protein
MVILVTILGSKNQKKILRILILYILRVSLIQISTKKGLNLSFAKKLPPYNKHAANFGYFFGVQEQK